MKATRGYHQADRIVGMIDEIRGRWRTVDELAARFEVCRRSIFRDLVIIERWWPLERSARGVRLPRRLFFPGGFCRICGEPFSSERGKHHAA